MRPPEEWRALAVPESAQLRCMATLPSENIKVRPKVRYAGRNDRRKICLKSTEGVPLPPTRNRMWRCRTK